MSILIMVRGLSKTHADIRYSIYTRQTEDIIFLYIEYGMSVPKGSATFFVNSLFINFILQAAQ